jgi:hypothetical protein
MSYKVQNAKLPAEKKKKALMKKRRGCRGTLKIKRSFKGV